MEGYKMEGHTMNYHKVLVLMALFTVVTATHLPCVATPNFSALQKFALQQDHQKVGAAAATPTRPMSGMPSVASAALKQALGTVVSPVTLDQRLSSAFKKRSTQEPPVAEEQSFEDRYKEYQETLKEMKESGFESLCNVGVGLSFMYIGHRKKNYEFKNMGYGLAKWSFIDGMIHALVDKEYKSKVFLVKNTVQKAPVYGALYTAYRTENGHIAPMLAIDALDTTMNIVLSGEGRKRAILNNALQGIFWSARAYVFHGKKNKIMKYFCGLSALGSFYSLYDLLKNKPAETPAEKSAKKDAALTLAQQP